MKNLDWIFFDLGGVIFDDSAYMTINFETELRVLKKYLPQITLEQIKKVYYNQASAIIGGMHENVLSCFLEKAAEISEALAEIKRVKKELLPNGGYGELLTKVRPETALILEKLEQKYHLGIIANQQKEAIELLKKAGIAKYFHHLKVSHHHGFKKPDPEYFVAVLKETGADPKMSVMIDDNLVRGLLPAKKLGMTTVWFKTNDYQPNNGESDYIIKNLSELLNIF
jgi:HAD superfamily hydrolase (TIGR01509 family)